MRCRDSSVATTFKDPIGVVAPHHVNGSLSQDVAMLDLAVTDVKSAAGAAPKR